VTGFAWKPKANRSVRACDSKIVKTYQRIEQPEDFSRPWAIVRLLPDLRRYTVARFHNKTDAQDHLRVLNRFIPIAEFEVLFDSEAGRDRVLTAPDLEEEEN
jgi:hypothetical protein